jgi:hypothetical protein
MSNVVVEEVLEEAKALTLSPFNQQQIREVLNVYEVEQGVVGLLLVIGLLHLLEKTNALTPEKQRQLEDLVNRAVVDSGLVDRASVVRAVRGKYAHLRISSEEFTAQKQEEIRLEDRR